MCVFFLLRAKSAEGVSATPLTGLQQAPKQLDWGGSQTRQRPHQEKGGNLATAERPPPLLSLVWLARVWLLAGSWHTSVGFVGVSGLARRSWTPAHPTGFCTLADSLLLKANGEGPQPCLPQLMLVTVVNELLIDLSLPTEGSHRLPG